MLKTIEEIMGLDPSGEGGTQTAAIAAFPQSVSGDIDLQSELARVSEENTNLRIILSNLISRVEFLEHGLSISEQVVILREIPRDEAKSEILTLYSNIPETEDLYYSDIAIKLGLDLKLVVELCQELKKEGKLKA